MKFVNRIEEINRFKRVLSGDKSTFTVIYGRRRLGKSTLISRVLSNDDVYYLADQTDATLQREMLAKMISVIIAGFDKVIYPSWNDFFDTLNERTTQKFTLCIDEFPYLVGSSPELSSILQNKILVNHFIVFWFFQLMAFRLNLRYLARQQLDLRFHHFLLPQLIILSLLRLSCHRFYSCLIFYFFCFRHCFYR